MECGSFYVSMTLSQKSDGSHWECVVVYGRVNHTLSEFFLRDLDAKLCRTHIPIFFGWIIYFAEIC
jgi:hypothetical protein